jgi:type II secretory pathway component PulM
MPSKNRERLLLIGVVACLGILLLDSLVVEPLIRLWSDRAKSITELQTQVRRGTSLIIQERKIMDRWRTMREESRSPDLAMTENDLLKAVGNWAQKSSLTVTALRPRRLLDEENCKKVEIRASTTGTMDAVVKFLYELEIDPQPLKVEDIELSSRDDKGLTLNCEVRVTRLVLDDKEDNKR